jgi:hypothetical protein
MPPIVIGFIHIKIEYFEEDIVGECHYGHPSAELAYAAQIQFYHSKPDQLSTAHLYCLSPPVKSAYNEIEGDRPALN